MTKRGRIWWDTDAGAQYAMHRVTCDQCERHGAKGEPCEVGHDMIRRAWAEADDYNYGGDR